MAATKLNAEAGEFVPTFGLLSTQNNTDPYNTWNPTDQQNIQENDDRSPLENITNNNNPIGSPVSYIEMIDDIIDDKATELQIQKEVASMFRIPSHDHEIHEIHDIHDSSGSSDPNDPDREITTNLKPSSTLLINTPSHSHSHNPDHPGLGLPDHTDPCDSDHSASASAASAKSATKSKSAVRLSPPSTNTNDIIYAQDNQPTHAPVNAPAIQPSLNQFSGDPSQSIAVSSQQLQQPHDQEANVQYIYQPVYAYNYQTIPVVATHAAHAAHAGHPGAVQAQAQAHGHRLSRCASAPPAANYVSHNAYNQQQIAVHPQMVMQVPGTQHPQPQMVQVPVQQYHASASAVSPVRYHHARIYDPANPSSSTAVSSHAHAAIPRNSNSEYPLVPTEQQIYTKPEKEQQGALYPMVPSQNVHPASMTLSSVTRCSSMPGGYHQQATATGTIYKPAQVQVQVSDRDEISSPAVYHHARIHAYPPQTVTKLKQVSEASSVTVKANAMPRLRINPTKSLKEQSELYKVLDDTSTVSSHQSFIAATETDGHGYATFNTCIPDKALKQKQKHSKQANARSDDDESLFISPADYYHGIHATTIDKKSKARMLPLATKQTELYKSLCKDIKRLRKLKEFIKSLIIAEQDNKETFKQLQICLVMQQSENKRTFRIIHQQYTHYVAKQLTYIKNEKRRIASSPTRLTADVEALKALQTRIQKIIQAKCAIDQVLSCIDEMIPMITEDYKSRMEFMVKEINDNIVDRALQFTTSNIY